MWYAVVGEFPHFSTYRERERERAGFASGNGFARFLRYTRKFGRSFEWGLICDMRAAFVGFRRFLGTAATTVCLMCAILSGIFIGDFSFGVKARGFFLYTNGAEWRDSVYIYTLV